MIKPITVSLPEDMRELRLYVLADMHLGDAGCEYGRIKDAISEIQRDVDARVILCGDLCNNATKSSVSDIYSERISPMEQINAVVDTIRPIADKVIGCVPGNHEERTYRQDGIDITRLIARELKFEDKYRETICLIFVRLGHNIQHGQRQVTYSIYASHGSGGGRKIGGKANRLNDLAMICDADLFIVGHTHTPMIFKDNYLRLSPACGTVQQVERTYLNTTAWLNYGGYGTRQAFTPTASACPVVTMDGRRKKITVQI